MKKLLSVMFCMLFVFMMSMTAFATDDTRNQENGIISFNVEDEVKPRAVYSQMRLYHLEGTNLYLNVNNSAHPGTASANDTVIVWTKNANLVRDETWLPSVGLNKGCFLRSELNLDLALNINHLANKCTLYPPRDNFTDGKSDSEVFLPTESNERGYIGLFAWNLFLTNSASQAGSTCYWTTGGSLFISE